jgi:hypothetical protein
MDLANFLVKSLDRGHVLHPSGGSTLSAMAIRTWWTGVPEQRFWMEITDRSDTGANLVAPQHDGVGKRSGPTSSCRWSSPATESSTIKRTSPEVLRLSAGQRSSATCPSAQSPGRRMAHVDANVASHLPDQVGSLHSEASSGSRSRSAVGTSARVPSNSPHSAMPSKTSSASLPTSRSTSIVQTRSALSRAT